VQRATRALISRGPDSQKQWIAPHGRVGLGQARLSTIGLTTGDQPIANEDGRLHIVANGKFYRADEALAPFRDGAPWGTRSACRRYSWGHPENEPR
jgi:asparagine synthetase B (glutamine-hydrolysing)